MFNLAMYGIVDKVLFQAHTSKAGLAMSLDMNDFMHVTCYTFHGALVEVVMHFVLQPNYCQPVLCRLFKSVQRLRGLCILFQHVRQYLRRLNKALVLKSSMSASTLSTGLPLSRRVVKQGSTCMVQCLSTSRFTNAIQVTRLHSSKP